MIDQIIVCFMQGQLSIICLNLWHNVIAYTLHFGGREYVTMSDFLDGGAL